MTKTKLNQNKTKKNPVICFLGSLLGGGAHETKAPTFLFYLLNIMFQVNITEPLLHLLSVDLEVITVGSHTAEQRTWNVSH